MKNEFGRSTSTARSSGQWINPLAGLSNQAKLVIVAAWGGWILVNMDAAMFTFSYPLIQKDLGLSLTAVSFIYTAIFVTGAVASLFAGMLADRWGRKPVFNVSIAFTAIGSLLTSFSAGLLSLSLFRSTTQLGASSELVAGQVMLSEVTPAGSRGWWNGVAQTGWPIGWFLASGLSAFVIPAFGWRVLFVIGVVPALLIAFVRLFVPESERFTASAEQRVADSRRGPAVAARDVRISGLRQLFEKDLRRTTIALFLWQSAYNYGAAGIIYWLPSIILSHHLSLANVYSISAIATGCGGFGFVAAATLGNRYGRREIALVWLTLGAIAGALFWYDGTSWGAIALYYSLFYFFAIGHMGATVGYMLEAFPTRVRATGMAMSFTACWIGFIGAAATGPLLFRSCGTDGAVLIWACIAVAIAAVCAACVRSIRPNQELEDIVS